MAHLCDINARSIPIKQPPQTAGPTSPLSEEVGHVMTIGVDGLRGGGNLVCLTSVGGGENKTPLVQVYVFLSVETTNRQPVHFV